ncbi:MAG: carboxymuconolactone decarboxylase family protein [Gammaproteobacteria bacterium]|nr:carboxymuconolactone decarboxylase family protein [Gammaproteobacteria bacterium]MCH9764086.1 carboxymuconolactone decarboxylase family protein [Gammaproteobacteria bacterium]
MRLSKQCVGKTAWYLKPFFWNQKRKYGQHLEPAKVWAMVPTLFILVASVYGFLDRKKSPISPALRSLISVRVSQINGCEFCVDLNSANLMKRTHSEEKIQHLLEWESSDLYSALEKTALRYAEKMTNTQLAVDDACFHALNQHFNSDEIVELTALIAFQNMSSKFNSALAIVPQGLCNVISVPSNSSVK